MFDPQHKPFALLILDGWSVTGRQYDPINIAHTPVYDRASKEFPGASLSAPESAEAGHLTLGAGRNIRTDAERIANFIETGELHGNKVIQTAFERIISGGSSLHLVSLISNSNREASFETLVELIKTFKRHDVQNVYIHCILDGKHSNPGTAPQLIGALQNRLAEIGTGAIASICGRFYAMDTGGNWERTARAFTMLVHGDGEMISDPEAAVTKALARGISEEFLAPMVVTDGRSQKQIVRSGDVVLFVNHRPDGLRQLASSFVSAENGPRATVLCLTDYDINSQVIFPKEEQANVLTQVISAHDISTCRVTEQSRANHITHVFDGGIHRSRTDDREFSIPSSNTGKHERSPEAGSFRIADCVRRELKARPGFFIINFPAVDLATVTAKQQDIIEAAQYVDTCLGGVLETLLDAGGTAIITSSHGSENAESVPFYLVEADVRNVSLRETGSLQDVAPTILGLMGFEIPAEITGTDLRLT